MPNELSIVDLATALLKGRVTTIAALASFLGVDVNDRKRMARFEKDCTRILPDIKERLGANDRLFRGPTRRFPDGNPFKENSLAHTIWECTKNGQWLALGSISQFVHCHQALLPTRCWRPTHELRRAFGLRTACRFCWRALKVE